MQTEVIQQVINNYFTATRSANKVEDMVACFAENSISYDPVGGPALIGHDGLRQFFQSIADLFEQIGLVADFISINGHEAAVKWTGKGVGKNGRAVTFEGIDIFEVNEDGKIQSLRAYWNPAAMLTELTDQ
ncbi:nuclear transport factor 2 family protein [Calothrix sp. PCC 7507]|uniref:nuclear transport factor 2 family protein n=1 Tax=Calothrix sp. PCC 7507 TaxID=99598 RepID=UPI00029F0EF5|nr:nuclear transport factor 2 family protein [Calothrix sp. PCC 7507]AFY36247.1 protein of unknown function DUF1486 [Calothrix sp. PCC 7507]